MCHVVIIVYYYLFMFPQKISCQTQPHFIKARIPSFKGGTCSVMLNNSTFPPAPVWTAADDAVLFISTSVDLNSS